MNELNEKNTAQFIRIAVDSQTLINSVWKKHLTDSMVVLMTGFMNWISVRTDCQTCESQYPMEDDQARIQPTWPKTINLRGSGASRSMCCTVLSTALQGKVEGRRVTVWTGAAMMMGGVEQQGEQRKLLISCQKVQEKVMQIPIMCVEEQTGECL